MKHLHSIYIAVTILLFSACSYNSRYLSNALKVAGDNRPELEAVLNHYKDNPEKLAAARFLIENMPAHRSYKGDEIVERIWGAVMEMVIAVTSVFNITDEEIYDAVINQSEELAHICEIYRLKMAV